MHDPLDDLYYLDNKHDQLAYNGLMELEEIQEELLWTSLPIKKSGLKDRLIEVFLLPFVFCGSLLLSEIAEHLTWWSFTLTFIGAMLFNLFHSWQAERARKQTFYGISATTIWIKRHKLPLKQFHIPDLSYLSLEDDVFSYSTIDRQVYNKYTIMGNIPNSEAVYQLLLQLQQENKQQT